MVDLAEPLNYMFATYTMDFGDGFLSEEHQELARSALESENPASASPLEVIASPRASPKANHGKHGPSRGSPVKHDRHSHLGLDDRPKKGGSGGKGTWGGLLDTKEDGYLDSNDPNYDSNEEKLLVHRNNTPPEFEEYRKKATVIVEEYFATNDLNIAANELRDVGYPNYRYYFVKKLVSMAMDRHDKEKEMAAELLSTFYADLIEPQQVHKGFHKLVESADDLAVDIPDTVDVLALFISRAVVDNILPCAFLSKQMTILPKDSKAIEVIKRAQMDYLSGPTHAEMIERKWSGSKNRTVEDVKLEINNILVEYLANGSKTESCHRIKDLKLPFFHHEVIKQALLMAMERCDDESLILDLLKEASEEGIINASQMNKGFERLIDSIDDISSDSLPARDLLPSLISKAASEGWLCASSLKPISPKASTELENETIVQFKARATYSIKEYFLTGDVSELISRLVSENVTSYPELNAILVKRLISLAMDRKNREKEMASVLLSSLSLPADDIVNGFLLLIESAEDTALDIPRFVEDLAMFLARAVVDEVLAPSHLEDIAVQFTADDSVGFKVHKMAKSLLQARLAGERILRCWGGAGGGGASVEDVKAKIGRLLEEYDAGGDSGEACRCIRELGMPFFHHEVVKKAMVAAMEKKDERFWELLGECFGAGLISVDQMSKGFQRVAAALEDLALDVPDVESQFAIFLKRAQAQGWLEGEG